MGQLEKRLRIVEGINTEERIQALERSNHEERIQALEIRPRSLCYPPTPLPVNEPATPQGDVSFCDQPVKEDCSADAPTLSFWNSPMMSLSALRSQWIASPLSSNLGLPTIPTPMNAISSLKKWVPPLRGLTSFSSSLISSFSPVTRMPQSHSSYQPEV